MLAAVQSYPLQQPRRNYFADNALRAIPSAEAHVDALRVDPSLFRVTSLQQQQLIGNRNLAVFCTVQDQHGRARPVDHVVFEQRHAGAVLQKFVEGRSAEHVRPRGEKIE